MKKSIATIIIAAALTSTLLSGCGSKYEASYESPAAPMASAATSAGYGYDKDFDMAECEEESYEEYAYEDYAYEPDVIDNSFPDHEDLDQAPAENSTVTDISQKLIVTYNIGLETKNYDELINNIHSSVSSLGGYIERENEYCYGGNSRYNNLCIRLPKDKAAGWLEGINDFGTITNRSQNQENVTLQYVDTESRLKSIRAEQEALLRLMDKAESIEDIINVQSQLTNVNYEIEYYESSLRSLTNRVEYTSVYLDISEVTQETVIDNSIGAQIRYEFEHSLRGLKSFLRTLVIGLVGNSVIIILLAAFIAVIVVLIRKLTKKRRAKKAAKAITAKESVQAAETDDKE